MSPSNFAHIHEDKAVGEGVRFYILLEKMLTQNWRSPVYLLRALQLMAMGFFLGTLYLRVSHSVEYLTELSGASFFNIWVVLFSVTASAPSYARDRRQVQQEHVNGSYKLSTHALATFVSCIPANIIAAILYQCVFHWLVGFNDTFEAFVYSVITSFLLMLLMESITLSVVEGLKDAMLSVTFSMIVLGMLFLMAGYFIKVGDLPPAVKWIPWLIPSKYALEGSLNNVFSGQDYDIEGGGVMTGDQILTNVFGHGSDVINKWANLAVVFAWAIMYRFVHYGMTLFTNRHFGKGAKAVSCAPLTATVSPANVPRVETVL